MTELVAQLKQSLGQADVKRKSLEMEAEAIISELTSKPASGGDPMGIDTPLIDREGYPRADIDVYRARELRHRLAVIRTDRKELMEQIDNLLKQIALAQNPTKLEEGQKELAARTAPKPKPKYDPKTGKWVVPNWDGSVSGVQGGENRRFDSLHEDDNNSNSVSSPTTTTTQAMDIDTSDGSIPAANSQSAPIIVVNGPPFALIDLVSPLSPAEEAGLKEGDLIVEFGNIDHTNHDTLRALPTIVAAAADSQQEIPIVVLRKAPDINATTTTTYSYDNENKVAVRAGLSPKPWPGRGLIGCHIVPYTS